MKKIILALMLMNTLGISAQTLFGHQKPSMTAQQDSIVTSFVLKCKKEQEMYLRSGHYWQVDESDPRLAKSIMQTSQDVLPMKGQVIGPDECSFFVPDAPSLFVQWGWDKSPSFFETLCYTFLDAFLK